MSIFAKYVAAWTGLVALAIVNGTIREKMYGPLMPELRAHQLSTLTGIIMFGGYMWGLMGMWELTSARQALLIGAAWLVMTVAFEFLFGHYVMGHSWHRLLQDYNLLQGRVWVLVLAWTAFGPCILYGFR